MKLCRLVLPGLLATMMATSLTRAEGEAPAVSDARADARPLATQGLTRFRAGDYRGAIESFREAESHYHSPGHLLFVARAQARLGELIAARNTYASIVEEKLPDYAPEAFREAQRFAQSELAALRKRIPTVRVVVRGVEASDVRIRIDGRSVAVQESYELAPGEHQLSAAAAGANPTTRSVVLAEGDREEVVFELDPRAAPSQPPSEPSDGHQLVAPTVVSFGLAAACLAAATATGVVSLQQVEDIEERCVDGHCPPEDEPTADEARALGNASTALFVIAGVAAAAGTTLLIVGWPEEPSTAATWRLQASPLGLQLSGSF
jgi:hypothetical protein